MNGSVRRTWQRLQSAFLNGQRTRPHSPIIGAPRSWTTTTTTERARGRTMGSTLLVAVGRRLVGHSPSLALALAAATTVPVPDTATTTTGREHHIRFDPVDGTTLTPQYLLRQMSVAATEAVQRMSTQALLAYLQAQEEYRTSLDSCLDLIEYGLTVMGNRAEEERVWEATVATRARADDRRRNVKELELLLSSVSKLASAAGETAFLLDSEFVTSLCTQHQYLVEREMDATQRLTRAKEKELLLLDERVIHETSARDKRDREKEKKKER